MKKKRDAWDKRIQFIQKCVAESFDLSVEQIVGRSRLRKFNHPRQIAMYLSRHFSMASFSQIARSFDNRDHTTIMHGIKNAECLMSFDRKLERKVSEIVKEINNGKEI